MNEALKQTITNSFDIAMLVHFVRRSEEMVVTDGCHQLRMSPLKCGGLDRDAVMGDNSYSPVIIASPSFTDFCRSASQTVLLQFSTYNRPTSAERNCNNNVVMDRDRSLLRKIAREKPKTQRAAEVARWRGGGARARRKHRKLPAPALQRDWDLLWRAMSRLTETFADEQSATTLVEASSSCSLSLICSKSKLAASADEASLFGTAKRVKWAYGKYMRHWRS